MGAPNPGTVLYAMAVMEGFFAGNDRPARNNNPLDLEYGPEAEQFGATGTDGRFAIYPDADTGWDAGRRWLSVPAKFDPAGNFVGGYMGATMEQVINRFAPPVENNSVNYLNFVCREANCQPNDVLTAQLLG